ncbi:MAG: DNA cytosine methyltransferase [Ignavibacteria bacterium]|nr:DNA cytosine methyltransferase [Ignavibacteria bacterium]
MESKLNYIDLFAGAGGLSEGFKRAGFEPVAHVEMMEAACYTMRTRSAYYFLKENGFESKYHAYLRDDITRDQLYQNIPKEILDAVIHAPIGKDTNDSIFKKIDQNLNGKREVDLIIGGPPCQAYSLVGRARSETNMQRDPRNFLYVQYAEYLERYQPKMFVFENVLGLKSAGNGIHLKNMERLFNKKGYSIELFTVNARQFGVLQNRRRIIIIGWKMDFIPNLPDLENHKMEFKTQIGRLFEDLPELQAGEGVEKFRRYEKEADEYLYQSHIRNGMDIVTQHVARPHTERDLEIYKIAVDKWNSKRERLSYTDLPDRLQTHRNTKSFFDRFKVVADNLEYSQTVVAHIAKDGHYYIHPDIEQNRSLTVREAARLQSFPDDFYFEGASTRGQRTASFTQIGNAVPPLMGYKIAKKIKEVLCQ